MENLWYKWSVTFCIFSLWSAEGKPQVGIHCNCENKKKKWITNSLIFPFNYLTKKSAFVSSNFAKLVFLTISKTSSDVAEIVSKINFKGNFVFCLFQDFRFVHRVYHSFGHSHLCVFFGLGHKIHFGTDTTQQASKVEKVGQKIFSLQFPKYSL